MKHVIVGGDGFVGRHLAEILIRDNQRVVVADIAKSDHGIYRHADFTTCDITDPQSVKKLDISPGDMVYNLSARMLDPIPKRRDRHDFYWPVNYQGVEHLFEAMLEKGATQAVHFTTDMIYGHFTEVPQNEDAPAHPLGEYGASKLASEDLCKKYRERGINVSIFRPRLIIGPGRLGILSKLFKLIDNNLPVPMIGSGRNPYQFVSVFDCADACVKAWQAGTPNNVYNLGSPEPPSVRQLLTQLIKEADSYSVLVPTPAAAVKATLGALDQINTPLMDPEQYLIADEECIVDCSRAQREIGWVPKYNDTDMLISAYRTYRRNLSASAKPASQSAAATPNSDLQKETR